MATEPEDGLPPQQAPPLRCLRLDACAGRRAVPAFAMIAALCGLTLTAAEAEDAGPPFHPSVGQKYVPTDVDWDRPVYRTSFDDASEVSRWRLEAKRRLGHRLREVDGGVPQRGDY